MHQRLLQGNDVLCFTRVRLKPEAVNKNAVKDCRILHTSLKTGARIDWREERTWNVFF